MKKAIVNFILLIIEAGIFDFYVYELIWGDMNKAIAKGVYYLSVFLFTIYLNTCRYIGFTCEKHDEINAMSYVFLTFNFFFFFLILFNILPIPVYLLLLFNGSIFVVGIMILTQGIRHGYYKN